MKKIIKSLLPIICAIIMSSCEEVAKVDVPVTEAKPVLFSFLSPEDSVVSVSVTMSVPIFTNPVSGYEPVSNALVKLMSSEGDSVTLTYDFNLELYTVSQSVYKIKPGVSYTITAWVNGKLVKGSTLIPVEPVYLTEVKVEAGSQSSSGDNRFLASYRWDDVSGKANYYRLNLEVQSSDPFQVDTQYSNAGDLMRSDAGDDGKVLTAHIEFYKNYWGSAAALNTYLLNTDYAYYEYHRRRLNYTGDDIFSEPLPQYSNIDGGLGVVGSYRKTHLNTGL